MEKPESQPSSSSQWLTQQRSYLLRLWCNGVDGEWHALLQSVQSGERHMFVDLEALLAFLVDEVYPPPKL